VAAMQSIKYPLYGIQFHPEKNPFEWKVFADRSFDGVEVVQMMANRLIEVARMNRNRFSSFEELDKVSIHNFNPQPTTMSFTEIYVFDEKPMDS
jgi:gamma-glutamyl hydrolase